MANKGQCLVRATCVGALLVLSFAIPTRADVLISTKVGGILPVSGGTTFDEELVFGAAAGFVAKCACRDFGASLLLGAEAEAAMSTTRLESGSRHGVATVAVYGTVRNANRLFLKGKLGPLMNWSDENQEGEVELSFGVGAGVRIIRLLSFEAEFSKAGNEIYFLTAGLSFWF